jgi:hypothetical protein
LQAPTGTKLYKYIRGSTAGRWHLESSTAAPRFYDAKEDGRGSGQEYYMEVDAGDIDVRVDEQLQYVADASQQRITFAAGGELWALKFAAMEGYREFRTQLGVSSTVVGAVRGLGCSVRTVPGFSAPCLLAAVCSQCLTAGCSSLQQQHNRHCICRQ